MIYHIEFKYTIPYWRNGHWIRDWDYIIGLIKINPDEQIKEKLKKMYPNCEIEIIRFEKFVIEDDTIFRLNIGGPCG